MPPTPDSSGGVPDTVDTPKHVQAASAQAEADVLLRYLLGVDINQDASAIATQVAQRVCSTVGAVRGAMTEVSLQKLLDGRLNTALAMISADPVDRPRVIAEAVYQAVPMAMLREFIERKNIPFASEAGTEVSRLEKSVDFGTDAAPKLRGWHLVRIDLDNEFWKKNSFPSANKLIAEIQKKPFKDFGIQIVDASGAAVAESYTLDFGEAQKIAGAANKWDVVRQDTQFGAVKENLPVGTDTVPVNIDVDLLVTMRTTADAPSALRNRSIGSLTREELAKVLAHPKGGATSRHTVVATYEYWQATVPELAQKKVKPTDNVPGVGKEITWAQTIADRIFAQAVRAHGSKLSGQDLELQQIQKEVHDKNEIYHRLKQDSQNEIGAALAATLIARDSSLAADFIEEDKDKVEKKLDANEQELRLLEFLDTIASEKIPTEEDSWAVVKGKMRDITLGISKISAGLHAEDTVTIGSASSNPEPFFIKAKAKKADVDAVRKRMNDRLAELSKLNNQYAAVDSKVKLIKKMFDETNKARIAAGEKDLKAPGTLISINANPAEEMKRGVEIGILTGDWKRQMGLKTKPEYEAEVEKNRKKLKDISDKKLTGVIGNDAQQHVFAKYFEKRGLKPKEAEQGSRYLQARTMVDGAMSEGLSDAFEDMFEDAIEGERGQLKEAKKIIGGIAKAAGIAAYAKTTTITKRRYFVGPKEEKDVVEGRPNWQSASYKQLATAYFALKKLYEGAGPTRMNLPKLRYVTDQMQEISRILTMRFAQAVVEDASEKASDDEKEKLKKNDIGATRRAVRRYLEGDPPERFKGRVDKVIAKAENDRFWFKDGQIKGYGKGIGDGVVYRGGSILNYIKKNPAKVGFLIGGTLLAGPVLGYLAFSVLGEGDGEKNAA
mgnify:CR=1 FL=1